MPRYAASRGRAPVSKAANPGSPSAAVISRARSARKFRTNTPSPSPMPAKSPITVGAMNSSVSPRPCAAAIAAAASGARAPSPRTIAAKARPTRSQRLSRSIAQ